MGKFGLFFKVDLENVTDFAPTPNMRWFVKLKCSNCGEETDKWNYLTCEEKTAVKGGRGEANLVIKCKGCKRENTVDIVEENKIIAENSATWTQIVSFEARGLEIASYEPRMGFTCKSVDSETSFEVDLSEGDWSEYDEKAGHSVGIYNLEYKIEKI